MTATRLTDEQRIDWLRLIRADGIGPRTCRTLIEQLGDAAAVLDALPRLGQGGRPVKVPDRGEAVREMERAARLGVRFIALCEPDYPHTLRVVDSAPPLIGLRGTAAILARPMVAIVGSRNASAAGLALTERLARDVGAAGFVIVSGLARGIDARAHRGALGSGTVAVLAGGHDRVYPAENEGLLDAILAQGGAALSEMPMGWEPRGRDFPRRNRVVSGLSYGVVVVEAARRSGSLITARFALEQGREVFAVPGSPLDPRAEGTNDLIRAGATLCAAAEHVTSVLEPLVGRPPVAAAELRRPLPRACDDEPDAKPDPWEGVRPEAAGAGDAGPEGRGTPPAPNPAAPGDHRSLITQLLGPAPISVDELARQSGLPIRMVHMTLLELELDGRLERHGGNAVSMIAK
ncbi:MAG TPA: DNA-processing protein DprA [Beijerinckiaceae bacterium]|jgi:DNA processing protein